MKSSQSIIAVLLALIIGALLLVQIIEPTLTSAATSTQTDTLSAAVGASTTTASFSLTKKNWYTTLKGASLTRGAGATVLTADITAKCTLATDRVTVSCAALTSDASTTTVTAVYLTDGGGIANAIYTIIPTLVILAAMAMAFGAVGASYAGFRASQGFDMGVLAQAGMTIFIGLILIAVVNAFVNNVNAVYSIAPAYIAVITLTGIVPIVYVIALLADASLTTAGMFKGGGRGGFGG